jgi:hypothetical protein
MRRLRYRLHRHAGKHALVLAALPPAGIPHAARHHNHRATETRLTLSPSRARVAEIMEALMNHLNAVPDLPDDDYFTSVPVCVTCPPHDVGFSGEWCPGGWEFALWHREPCPRAGEPPAVLLVPGCEVCHTWGHADFQVSALVLPGFWVFHPKHGRTALTSLDGTAGTASGGDYCPLMEADNARVARTIARREG